MLNLVAVSPAECCKSKGVLIYCLGMCAAKKDKDNDDQSIEWGACERYRAEISGCQL